MPRTSIRGASDILRLLRLRYRVPHSSFDMPRNPVGYSFGHVSASTLAVRLIVDGLDKRRGFLECRRRLQRRRPSGAGMLRFFVVQRWSRVVLVPRCPRNT